MKKLIALLLMATSISACNVEEVHKAFIFEGEKTHEATGIFCKTAEEVMKIVELVENAGNSIDALKKTIDEFNAAHPKDTEHHWQLQAARNLHQFPEYSCVYDDARIVINKKPVKAFKAPTSGDAEVLSVQIVRFNQMDNRQKYGTSQFEAFTARSTSGPRT